MHEYKERDRIEWENSLRKLEQAQRDGKDCKSCVHYKCMKGKYEYKLCTNYAERTIKFPHGARVQISYDKGKTWEEYEG